MKTIKTAVLGLGRIGWQYHLPVLLSHEGFEVVGVVEPVEDRQDECRQAYPSIPVYARCEELFAAIHPELVVIASPTHVHMEQAILAFEHGSDVFCDKPLAVTYEQAIEMAAAARAAQRKLMVYQPHRITPEFLSLQRLLGRGLIGEIHLIKRSFSDFVMRNDWQAQKKYGGGMLRNHGAHYLDQLLKLHPSSVESVFCITRTVLSAGDAEDCVHAVLKMTDQSLCELDINMGSAIKAEPWRILGNRGSIVLQPGSSKWVVRYVDGDLPRAPLQEGLAAENRSYGDGLALNWEEEHVEIESSPSEFYDYCYEFYAENKAPFVPIEETLQLMKVFSLCEESAVGGCFVAFDT